MNNFQAYEKCFVKIPEIPTPKVGLRVSIIINSDLFSVNGRPYMQIVEVSVIVESGQCGNLNQFQTKTKKLKKNIHERNRLSDEVVTRHEQEPK